MIQPQVDLHIYSLLFKRKCGCTFMDLNEFGRYITTLRNEMGLTQNEIADKLFVSGSAVPKWERGLTLPEPGKFDDIAKLYGVNIADLLNCGKKTKDNSDTALKDVIDIYDKELNKKNTFIRELIIFTCLLLSTIIPCILFSPEYYCQIGYLPIEYLITALIFMLCGILFKKDKAFFIGVIAYTFLLVLAIQRKELRMSYLDQEYEYIKNCILMVRMLYSVTLLECIGFITYLKIKK